MKLIGIDYGSKRIGIAISDENGKLAFPRAILKNDNNLITEICKILEDKEIGGIVVGESFSEGGKENTIMKKVREFIEKLKDKTKIPIYFEKEFFTTIEARRFQEHNEVDDSAAALILQRYLDKQQ